MFLGFKSTDEMLRIEFQKYFFSSYSDKGFEEAETSEKLWKQTYPEKSRLKTTPANLT